jgi:putative peptide zinc metalloprotease protein
LLISGTRLCGPYQDSAFDEERYLIGRCDGRMLLVSPAVYAVASLVDGERDLDEIARRVGEQLGGHLDAASLERLIDTKLRPLGVVGSDGEPSSVAEPAAVAQPPGSASPLLSLGLRVTLLRERPVQAVAGVFSPLFHPAAVVSVLLATATLSVLTFARYGIFSPLLNVLLHPRLVAATLGLTVLAVVFHEIGHAAACRYGGGRPGRIGFGLYLLVPAFFTNVTDSYRLSRAARLRTDLGGVYFNCVAAVPAAAVGLATGSVLARAVLLLIELNLVQQLLPFVRLDGYFVLSDLVGVPDLFASRTLLRRRHPGAAGPRLRRRAQLVVGAWTLVVVPTLVALFVLFAVRLPRYARASWSALVADVHAGRFDVAHHSVLALFFVALTLVVLTLPYAGMLLLAVRSCMLGLARVNRRRVARAEVPQRP